jgi:hypothetical protein
MNNLSIRLDFPIWWNGGIRAVDVIDQQLVVNKKICIAHVHPVKSGSSQG